MGPVFETNTMMNLIPHPSWSQSLPQIAALGGVAIVLLSAVIDNRLVSLLNATVGISISIATHWGSKDGIVVTRILLNILFVFTACWYLPSCFHEINYVWIPLLSVYAIVYVLMRLTYNEIEKYSSYWLLQRPVDLPQAREIFDSVLSSRDIAFLETLPSNQYENLVIAGGGAKGVYEIAALYPLQQAGILQNIQRFCGTSVGSILAVAFAAGATVEKAMEIAIHADLSMVVPPAYMNIFGFFFFCIPCRISRKNAIPGATRGLTLRFQYMLKRLDCDENITMSEFKAKFGKDLVITVSNCTTQKLEFLTAESHPAMPVYLAMRASSSIPGVFLPVFWKGNLYIDGSYIANHPVWAFDSETNVPLPGNKYAKMNMKTIGLTFVHGELGGISSSETIRQKSTFRTAGKAIAESQHLVRRQRCSTMAFPRMKRKSVSPSRRHGMMFHPTESEAMQRQGAMLAVGQLVTPRNTLQVPGATSLVPVHEPVSEAIIQMANYPKLIIGSVGLTKMYLAAAEFMFQSQNHSQESDRTIMLGNSTIGILEFSVTRDQNRMNQVAKGAVKSTMSFLRRLAVS